ncbi:ABC transporter G family member 44 [Aegilops tauschii subsp. strangulata]|uniref:ABC transporter domain-containing protein n=1 Tax=Aegilops tauschii subsp. strangulata TaxID=200361 RepID=A0A453SIN3_AEGTS|nr:ABC transporter G family member 44 [Aegilops tauschii subsp. strangulata]
MDTGEAAFGVASLRLGSSYRERGGGDVFSRASSARAGDDDDEEALMWAALERLPTHARVRKGIVVGDDGGGGGGGGFVDVAGLGFQERTRLLDRLVRVAEEDHERFLLKLKQRIDRVGIDFPTIEVRYDHLNIEALAHVGNRGLPTFINTTLNSLETLANFLRIIPNKKIPINILHDVNGIIKPKRMTLLLGPPGSGKTTLLLALAGKLGSDLKVSGKVTYNGHGMNEFVAQRSAAYISQHDLHIAEMTVRETLAFSARCQGVGSRYDMLTELSRREKAANIKPDPDLDVYMKAISVGGQDTNIITDYILKILGLDICADTMVGDDMLRGISGGQRKRVTTGEMMVGAERALFMDEISTGLDSSTTYQIVKSLGLITNILSGTTVISLLQPAPETYNLFDDIILLSDGHIVYQGPREHVLEFFESMGFKCPDRKGVADFLQEVTSRKDQPQYWARSDRRYQYVPVKEFARAFQAFHAGQSLSAELSRPFDRSQCHPASLTTSTYGASKTELLRACIEREWLLMKRNMFVYRFRAFQLLVMTVIVMTLFLRTNMHHRTVNDGIVYLGALFFAIVAHMFNGFSELALATIKLPVFFKQRDYLFFPAWAYAIPTWILKIPISCVEVAITVFLGYYVIGFDPDVGRLFKQYLLLLFVNQMAAGLFRFIAALGRTMVVANTLASFALLVLLVLSGFVLSHHDVKKWWIWGYWMSPLQYAMSAIAVNEFLGDKWQRVLQGSNRTLGIDVLKSRGFFTEAKWYWIGVGALLGYVIVFNILFTLALSYLKPLGKSQQILSEDALKEKHANITGETPDDSISAAAGNINSSRRNSAAPEDSGRRGMVLPFAPLAVAFNNMRYSVDMPAEMKAQGVDEDRLLLLKGVSGSFKPGVLTALMGVSGAGKTTLMDVLAGRKTGGYIEGDISISGYPKKQETFARISGYCEQNDIHSPNVTVYESLVYSAWLRLPSDVESETRKMFIEQVMELVELNSLRDALVGLPGVNGLSTEQRKRLTIAVELVANPSIIFMDEPTSGLDARAAAIVMRTVRNTVDTGRTVVCTIHQPSIDIFEAFDELFLMKRGGEEIYVGPLGHQSCDLIQYFEGIERVSKIKPGYNPATWMLEVTSQAQEDILGVSFAEVYKNSDLYQRNQSVIRDISRAPAGSKDLYFPTQYSQSSITQCMACLWKQHLSYWRNPQYTVVRFFFSLVVALMFGTIFWQLGGKRSRTQDLFNAMGSMYAAVLFMGISYSSSVQPVVAVERTVFYRERAAGMYSALPYAFGQVVVELPYVLVQSLAYGVIVYAMIGFQWDVKKFCWYLYFMYFTLLYFTYYGMLAVGLTPSYNIASIVSSFFYGVWNLFSGFVISRPTMPVWWRWYSWVCPVSWTLYGLVASQFGDLTEPLQDSGVPINAFLKSFFGFEHDFLGVVAVVTAGFAVLFAVAFGLSIKVLNFQRR